MKVLIFGASGFIGLPIATAFTRAGHTVLGQSRSSETCRMLEAQEITPILAEPSDVASWIHLISQVDVVIDAVGGPGIGSVCSIILDAVVKEAIKSRPNGPALEYIYTSGTWVHGDHPNEPYGSTSDRAPVDDPMPLTAWRLPHERAAFAAGLAHSTSFSANVIRPSLLYGKSASLVGELFTSARQGTVKFGGKGTERVATIHADDLAELFVLVAEQSPVVKGIVFEGSNPYPESIANIVAQLIAVSGAKGPVYSTPTDPFHEAIASTNLLRPTLGRSLVGWQPRKAPLAEGMLSYYHAWLATQPEDKITKSSL